MHHFPRPTQGGAILLCWLAIASGVSVAAPRDEPSRQPTAQPGLPSGLEIDFVIPIGNKLKCYECKWAEMPPPVTAFHKIANLVGKNNILHTAVITPVRGRRKSKEGYWIEDCVGLESLQK